MAREELPVTVAPSSVAVARVEPEHIPALSDFYRQVWEPEATPDRVRESRARAAAANPVTPGEPPPTWVVLREGRAIGHVTTIPITLWLQGRDRPAYWIKGLWVLPEFQRSAVGFLLLRAAAQALSPTLALVHEPAALRLFGALGFTDLGSLPNELRVLNAGRFLTRLDLAALGLGGIPRSMQFALQVARAGAQVLGPIADAATALWAAVASGPLGDTDVDVTPELDREGADQLWSAVRPEVQAAPARGASQLAERYQENSQYMFVHVRALGRLVGLGVVKRPTEDGDPRLRGIRVATLSDLLYQPSRPRTGLALLRGVEQAARTLGADALLCGASPAVFRSLARRRGYLRVPNNLHVLASFPGEGAQPPARLEQWWVTRGDSGGDGVF